MKKPSVKNKSSAKQPKRSDDRRLMTDSSFLKIGAAAKILGVSIDTLRRWEKSGKITAVRTPGGTRLYSLMSLRKISPVAVEDFQAKSLTTEELLLASQGRTLQDYTSSVIPANAGIQLETSYSELDPRLRGDDNTKGDNDGLKKSFLTKFLIGSAVLSVITLLITSWITASYLTNPKETQQFFKNNVASGILSPFHLLAEETVAVISPEKAKELGFISSLQGVPLEPLEPTTTNVLAVTTSPKFLEVNSDTQINGSLSVRDNINGLTVEATPSASTLALISGDTTLTITNSSTIDQDLATAASPTFNTLNLSATKDQLVFQSGGLASPAGGPTGTLTWTPTAQRTITLPDATTTLVGIDTTQTLTNKSMSGSSNTFTNIPNSALSNSKVTVTAGTNLSGGGDINLGSSATISLKDSVSLSGTLGVTGATTLSSTLSVSGASTLSSTLAVTGATTLSSSLAVSGNVGIGYTGSTVIAPSLGLTVQGNVGIGTTSPNFKLDVNGIVNATSLYVNGSPYIGSQWTTSGNDIYYTTGNVGVGFTSPSAALTIGSSEQFRVSSTGNLIRINDVPYSFPSSQAAAANYVLANDASGNLSWQAVAGVGGVSGTGTAGGVTYWNGTSTVTDSIANFYWDSVNNRLGIGTSAPQYRLDVAGTGRFTGFVGIGSSLNVSGNVGIGQSLTVSSGTVLQGGLAVTGGSVVLPAGSIQNSELENSAITVTATAGTGLSVSGSPVSLGGTLTIAGIDASTTVKGVASFNSTNFSVSSGAVNTIQDIATSSSPTFSNLTLTGNLGVGGSLVVTGNVGIGKSLSVTDLGVFNKGITVSGLSNLTGNVGIGGSASVASFLSVGSLYSSGAVCLGTDCRTVWPVTVTGESTTASNGLTLNGYDVRLGGMLTQATGIDINSQNFGFLGNIGIGTSANSGARLSVMGGNVGIGTTSPLAGLHVVGDVLVDPKSSSSSTTEGTIYYDSDDDQLKVYANGKWQSDRSTATLIVAASDSQNKEKADYVADGAGGTDDTTTIESAITALPSGGGIVVLLDGTYSLDSSIDITKSNVTLTGTGRSTIVKVAAVSGNVTAITVGDGGTTTVTGVVISNLQIDGNKTGASGQHGIYFNKKVTQSKIINNWIHDNDTTGIYLYSTSGSENTYNIIEGNDVRLNSYFGILLSNSDNNTVINNIGFQNAYGSIYLSNSDYNTITGNYVNDSTASNVIADIYLSAATYNTISSNVFVNTGSGYRGIHLESSSNHNTITGNVVSNHNGTEIRIEGSDNNIISSNRIQDADSIGIHIADSTSDNNYIIGNEISGVATPISDSGTGTTIQQRDQFEVEASGTTTALTVSQASTGDILNLLDGTTEVFTVLDGGNVGIGTTAPLSAFQIGSNIALGSKTLSFSTLTGNLGIGTTTPGATLSVAGSIGIGVSFANASVPSNGLAVSGNVGIGTTTADYNLSVIGTANFTGNVGIGGSGSISSYLSVGSLYSGGAICLSTDCRTTWPTAGSTYTASNGLTLSGTDFQLGGFLTQATGIDINSQNFGFLGNIGIGTSNNTGARLSVMGGNVGIGFTSPDRLLQIGADIANSTLTVGTLLSANGSQFAITGSTASNLTKKLTLGLDTTGNYGFIQAGNNAGVGNTSPYILSLNPAGGNVGIGTTIPRAHLDVAGGINAHDLILSSSFGSILQALSGFNGYTGLSGGIGTGGVDSITAALRLTSAGNLVNIASIQAGETYLTGGGTFNTQVTYATGTSPLGVAMGDVNGDGQADLAVTNNGSTTVSVFTNKGNGTFNTQVTYATGTSPWGVAMGDVNGDGQADLAVANLSSTTVSVFTNKGNGTFNSQVTYATGTGPRDVAMGDVNGDGQADLAVTNSSSTTVSVFINKGDGTFNTQVTYATGSSPWGVAMGDVNGDGQADLAVANYSGTTVSVFTNKGNGTFNTQVTYATGTSPVGVAMGDVNGDGQADLAVTNNGSTTVSVFTNKGDGTFNTQLTYATGTGPLGVAMGDVNGDGKADLAVTNLSSTTVSVFTNKGDGTFNTQVTYATGSNPRGVAMGDVNGDGKADLAVANTASTTVSVFTNKITPILHVQASNNRIGIGTSFPNATLSILGNVGIGYTNPTSAMPANGLAVSGNVGIGTTTANSALSVNGGAAIGQLYSTGNAAPANGLIVQGNVGIGTSIPGYLVDVAAGNSKQLYITSDLSSGARSTDVLTISQANNATYNSTENLLQLINSDTGSTGAVLAVSQGADYSSGISVSTGAGGYGISINTNYSGGGSAFRYGGTSITSGKAIDILSGDSVSGAISAFTGDLVKIGWSSRTNSSVGTVNDTGNFLDVNRNFINSGSGSFNISGDLATFSSNCTQTSSTCTDTSRILSLSQNYANATGAVLAIDNAGSGASLAIMRGNVGIGTSVPGGALSIMNGNVGIGTTFPNATLSIQGSVGIGYTGATSVIPSNGLAVSGNVGVGTTSPLGALHVIGQCVTWDTRIRIRRRRRGFGDPREEDDDNTGRDDVIPADAGIQLTTSDSELDPALRRDDRTGKDDMVQYDYLEVMIKDILPGDEVLSLNENTQEFEYQKIEKLLDMGIKGVYELTTASGRKIKTTANHPYLTKFTSDGGPKGLLRGGIVHQSPIKDAGWIKVINLAVGDQIAVAEGLSFGTGRLFTKDIPDYSQSNNRQGKGNLSLSNLWGQVNHNSSDNPSALTAKYQDIIASKISAVNISESLVVNMTINQPATKFEQTAENTLSWAGEGLKENLSIDSYSSIDKSTFQWDEIVSIKYLGYEHVYDLQISNTHNFLANDIVAHNTYINGSLGIGAYSGLTVPSNGLAVSGNVGIGTTTANSALSVNGGAAIGQLYSTGNAAPANGLIVQGNVGIGTSIPGYLVDIAAGNSKQLYITSDLSSGARSTDVLTITQPSSSSYNSTADLLQLTNSDTESTGALIDANQAASGGNGISITLSSMGNGISGTGLLIGGSTTIASSPNNFSGDYIKVNPTRTINSPSITDSGNFLELTRNNTNSSGFLYTISGDLATFSSNCTQTSGTCTDTSRILSLAQLYPSASGAVLAIDNAGSGASLAILRGNVGIGTSVPGGALSIMNGNVGIGTTFPNATLSIQGSVGIGYTGASSVIPSNGLAVSGNVGIGTTTANSNLSVAGSAHIGGLYQGIAAPANGLFVDGNVGIGATTSNNKLDVWGNQRITGTLTVDQTTTLSSLGIGVVQSNSSGVLSSSALNLAGGSSYITGILPIANGGTNNSSFTTGGAIFYDGTRLNQNTANFYWDNTNSRLGIGTSAPTAKLDIAGTTSTITNSSGNITITPAGNLIVDTGNVGIGTTIVDYKLKVSGTGYFSGFVGIGSSLNVSGNVGVGGSLTVTSGTVLQGGLAVTGGSVVLPAGSIQNSELENSSISVTATAGTGISVSGSPVSLGGTLTVAGIDASTTVKGVASFNSTNFSVSSGAVNTIQDIATSSSPTFSALTLSGNNAALTLTGSTPSLTSGANSFSIFSGGNVGIGTSANLLGALTVRGAGTGTNIALQTYGSNLTQGLTVLDNGNVGIGTTGPVGVLHLKTSAGTFLDIQRGKETADSPAGNAVIRFRNTTGTEKWGFGYSTQIGDGAGISLWQDGEISKTRLYIADGGNVGIGTSNPTATLQVQGNVGIGYTGVAIPSNGLAVFGNVGIGTTTANSTLSINGSAHIGGLFQGISAPANGLFVDGNVGIGATTSDNKLDVWGNARVAGTLTVDSTSTFGGNLTLAGNLLPSINDNFDLGSDSARWNNLYLGPSTLHLGTSTSDEYTLAYDTTNNRLGFNVNGSGPAEIVMDSSGNVGIGTTGPGQKLDVQASGTNDDSIRLITGNADGGLRLKNTTAGGAEWFIDSSGTGSGYGAGNLSFVRGVGGTNVMTLTNGNVGIGTTEPQQKLHINSAAATTALVQWTINGSYASYAGLAETNNAMFQGAVAGDFAIRGNTGNKLHLGVGDGSAGPAITISSGNVGIGTTNPGARLTVIKDDNTTGSIASFYPANLSQGTRLTYRGLETISGAMFIDAFSNQNIVMQTQSTGNVGIGTTSPAAKFEVSSGTVAPWSRLNPGDSTFTVSSSKSVKENFNLVSGTGVLDKISTVPVYTFDFINGSKDVMGLLAEDFYTIFGRGDASAINYQEVMMANWLGTQQLYKEVVSQGHSLSTQGVTLNRLSGALSVSGGNVGIGTSNPTSALDVAGKITSGVGFDSPEVNTPLLDLGPATIASSAGNLAIQFSSDTTLFQIKNSLGQNLFQIDASGSAKLAGTITTEAGAFDVAEDYLAKDGVEAGDVVSLVTTSGVGFDSPEVKESGVEKSYKPYDNSIIGIISTNPGISLKSTSGVSSGSPEMEIRPVALNGRVPVKVSTENGAINVGDYLTSSSTPGVAMRATKPGTVIGKALEAFPTDTSEVKKCDYTSEVDCGKIVIFINISFADPGNFLASLSLDDQGNMIIPKIRTSSLLLDPSVASTSSQLTINDQRLTINSDPNYTSPGPNLATGSNQYIDLSGEIASLEDRIAALESVIASAQSERGPLRSRFSEASNLAENEIATSSATPRDDIAEEATSSASLATSYQLPATDLNLTPPDILLATGSATLANLTVTSEATVSGLLIAYQAQIQDNFKVLGQTTLADTLIAGELTVDGTLSMENGNEINVIGYSSLQGDALEPQRGVLYLQKSPLAQGLDIFNGLVTIDPGGNITTQGKVIASEVNTNKLTISNTPLATSSANTSDGGTKSLLGGESSASIGSATILASQTKVPILTNQITPTSKVFITPRSSTLGQAPFVELVEPGTGFVVSIDNSVSRDIDFDWWIVETR